LRHISLPPPLRRDADTVRHAFAAAFFADAAVFVFSLLVITRFRFRWFFAEPLIL
jgi:hypothetical protein